MTSGESTNDEGHRPAPEKAQVRAALLRFADLVHRLEEDGTLLRNLPFLQGRLGDIRRMVFDYEVRVTERLLPTDDPVERASRRIVEDAIERERTGADEWSEDDQAAT